MDHIKNCNQNLPQLTSSSRTGEPVQGRIKTSEREGDEKGIRQRGRRRKPQRHREKGWGGKTTTETETEIDYYSVKREGNRDRRELWETERNLLLGKDKEGSTVAVWESIEPIEDVKRRTDGPLPTRITRVCLYTSDP